MAKTTNILIHFTKLIIVILPLFVNLSSNAQNCSKKKLATKEMRLEYDYRGQSLFIELGNGDSKSLNIVLYSKQNYRIFVVAEQKLGKVDYEVIVPRKKFNRIVKDVQPKIVTVYKKDPNGFYLYNTDGERIPTGEEIIMDTTWTRKTTTTRELIYDSRTAESPYWLATPNKTQLITINVHIEATDKIQNGCVGVYVGREFSNIYQFRR
jgi:hypothetical protein